MSRSTKTWAGGRRLLALALALAVAPAAARAQQPKADDLGPQAKIILTKYCAECHGKDLARAKKKINVLDRGALLADKRKLVVPGSPDASLLIRRVEDRENPMPPEFKPQPSDAERKALRAWVAAGAPGFEKAIVQAAPPAPTPAPVPAPPPPAPAPAAAQPKPAELAAQAKAILTRSCLECHGKPGKKVSGDLKILDHTALLEKGRKLVVPRSPDDSILIQRVEDKEDPMPPKPRAALAEADRKVLRAWIAAGAPAFPGTPAVTAATPPATTAPAPAVRLPALEEALLREQRDALEFLRSNNFQTAGFLKFRVKKPGEVYSDSLGPINQTLATRLELATILADDKKPVGIIRGASDIAALIPNANHRASREGRQLLLGPKYPLAWGDDTPVQPDAFFFGEARISPSLRVMGVTLFAFGKDGDKVAHTEEFYVRTDPGLLIEAGESYLVRGVKPGEPVAPTKAIDAMVALRNQAVLSPLLDPEAPVKLEVRYDDKPVQVQFKDGKFEMPAPKPGQKLTFVLRRQAAAEGRLAVVLKVNGQNTLFRERLPDAQCRKWVLEPGKDGLTVDHILTEDPADKGELVLPVVPKAKPGEFRYGADVGTVSLVVFREAKGPETAARSAADDVAVVARAGYPNDRAKDLPALKDQLRKEAAPENAAHGFGAPAKLGGEPQEATFRADPTPVMAVTINCGRP